MIFSRSLSAGLSHITRTQLESTLNAVRQRGISVEYAAIPADYPLRGAFDFGPDALRTLFEFAANCAAADRFWISARAPSSAQGSAPLPDSAAPLCPADDAFMEHLAALRY